ncbi:hypothetical protein KL930_001784 [Ogataea haglerorum]|uniref:Zn(2)-C6 fungal-type domain-containing protein n=1 Tax=Ogataea haglerorum TaxID=1937702 RepID=A0ABQ7RKA5_9ASCO|nr:hypothetical protein KL915_001839 [Ogataea haglerorum]KAG7699584.1 hypothetical protein KL951_001301 [Ogataea haglerorum]KAG7708343.1 hypothetical protein KL914_002069 [Ogataea haglerorum]KAG7710629.1 hypothetical protein KL950_001542 [Ogataea haglerorum]KAG7721250.1 hypothetical protein KL913_000986 [Ogataea haglerorum]
MSKSRTKSGCFTCRKRKKKCDERFPVCSGCSRNFLHCSWPEKRGAALPRNYEIKAATSPSQLPQPDPEDPSEYPIPSHMCFVFELDSYKHQDRKMAPRFDILTSEPALDVLVENAPPFSWIIVAIHTLHALETSLRELLDAQTLGALAALPDSHTVLNVALRVRLARRATARASAGVARDAREARGRENHKAARPGETQNDAHVDGHPDARDPDPAPGPHAGPVPDAAEPCRVQGALLCAGDSLLEARGRRHRGGQPCGTVLPRAAAGRARRAVGQLAHAAAVPATDRRLRGPQNGAP